jgi:hypothetical protein
LPEWNKDDLEVENELEEGEKVGDRGKEGWRVRGKDGG